MLYVTLILKSGFKIQDRMSIDNYDGITHALSENRGLASGPANISFDGVKIHGLFPKSEIAGVYSETVPD